MGNDIPYDFGGKRLDCCACGCVSSGVHSAQGVGQPFIPYHLTEDVAIQPGARADHGAG